MKYLKSKKISPKKYELTLEVSEYDLEMLENFATTYAPFEIANSEKVSMEEFNKLSKYCDYSDKYQKWLMKMWRAFWMLWKEHDEY